MGVVMLFKNNNVSDAVKIDFAPYYHEQVHEVPPRLDKKSVSLPMKQQQSPRNVMSSHSMYSSMTPRIGNGNGQQQAHAYNQYASEYIKYQYQCYALWHQQQCQQYYAAAMMHVQAQSHSHGPMQRQQQYLNVQPQHQQHQSCKADYARLSQGSVSVGGCNGQSGYSMPGLDLDMHSKSLTVPEPTLNYPMSPNMAAL